ncbi:TdeIII family type II restriction endonuclease, partial [Proteus terrae]
MNDLHQRMKFLVKERAVRLLGLDEKVERLSQAIDDGDTNIFFLAMFGKDVMLKAKLIMSLQTSFGMSFYEQISKSLGELA